MEGVTVSFSFSAFYKQISIFSYFSHCLKSQSISFISIFCKVFSYLFYPFLRLPFFSWTGQTLWKNVICGKPVVLVPAGGYDGSFVQHCPQGVATTGKPWKSLVWLRVFPDKKRLYCTPISVMATVSVVISVKSGLIRGWRRGWVTATAASWPVIPRAEWPPMTSLDIDGIFFFPPFVYCVMIMSWLVRAITYENQFLCVCGP